MQIATPVSPSATGPTIQQTLWDQRHAEQQQWKFEPQLPAVGAPANDGVLHMSSSGSPFKPQLSATHASDSAAAPVLMRSPIPGFRPLSASAVSRPQSATRASALGTFTPPYTAHKRLRKRPVELEVSHVSFCFAGCCVLGSLVLEILLRKATTMRKQPFLFIIGVHKGAGHPNPRGQHGVGDDKR